MTDREFKRLSRAQLIEIIYQLQLREEELVSENQKMKEELEEKRIRVQQAGNLAEAVLGINNIMQVAQDAAEQYLEEIRMRHAETEAICRRILEKAKREAATIVASAAREQGMDDRALEALLEKYRPDR